MNAPSYVENDPWLKPFTPAIVGRLEYWEQREKNLLLNNSSLDSFANGHLFFGCHKTEKSWIFREWAPNATNICLVGTFSNWEEHVEFVFEEKDHCWELEVPLDKIKHGDLYKLSMYWKGGHGFRIPAWATRVVQDEQTKIFSAQIWDKEPYVWKNPLPKINQAPLIYEAHVGMATEEYKVGTYSEFTKNVLPIIKEAGYNTVQLMAIQEHPYYGSFGYHVSSFFAASSRFGTPEELKELIDTAHGMGMRVIMDLIHSHAVKNTEEGLGKYDGTDYQFFHKGPKGTHGALMVSGISARSGRCRNLPALAALSHSIQGYLLWLKPARFASITSRDFDFSRTPTICPGFTEKEGMLTTLPSTVMCL